VVYPQVKICESQLGYFITILLSNVQSATDMYTICDVSKSCIDLVVHYLRLILQDFDGINFHILVLEIFDTLMRIVGEIVGVRE
jgi:hypothetical protein